MTLKEKLFSMHYPACGEVGRTAAIKAGYSEKSAAVTASKLLKKPEILKAISDEKEKLISNIRMDQKEVIDRLQAIARRQGDYSGCAVKEARLALVDIGKILGMKSFTDKIIIREIPFAGWKYEQIEGYIKDGTIPPGLKLPDLEGFSETILAELPKEP